MLELVPRNQGNKGQGLGRGILGSMSDLGMSMSRDQGDDDHFIGNFGVFSIGGAKKGARSPVGSPVGSPVFGSPVGSPLGSAFNSPVGSDDESDKISPFSKGRAPEIGSPPRSRSPSLFRSDKKDIEEDRASRVFYCDFSPPGSPDVVQWMSRVWAQVCKEASPHLHPDPRALGVWPRARCWRWSCWRQERRQ